MHALLSKMIFAAILYPNRVKTPVTKSVFHFVFEYKFVFLQILKWKFLKRISSMKTAYFWILFKKQPAIFFIKVNGFVHKVDQNLHIRKFP